jgi:hypothetical protein
MQVGTCRRFVQPTQLQNLTKLRRSFPSQQDCARAQNTSSTGKPYR